MEQQEVELLRQRVAFLEEMLERCMEQIRAVESRLALIEGRRSTTPLSEETVAELAREVSDIITRTGEGSRSRRIVE